MKPSRFPIWTYVLAGSPCLLIGGVIGYAVHRPAPSAEFKQSPTVVVQESKLFPGAKLNWGGSGVYKVPAQAAPGKYAVGVSGAGCIWHRWRTGSDPLKSSIDSGTLNRGGFAEVTVDATDDRFELVGDCEWVRQ